MEEIMVKYGIPEEEWSITYVTEDGMVFRARLDEDRNVVKIGEEVYQEYLEDKHKPVEPQPTDIEILRLEQAKANAEMIELMMSMLYGGGM